MAPMQPVVPFAPFAVLHEDAHLLAVAKPAGVVTHPAYRNPTGTLTDAVHAWYESRGLPRPWLIHRLDKDTSGLVLFARTERAMRLCARQFADHTAVKHYLAVACGANLPDEGLVDAPLRRDPADRRRVIVAPEGQPAQTSFAVRARFGQWCMVDLWPLTGRTHQLRAHLAHLGHPIVGDPVYAAHLPAVPGVGRLLLHAAALSLRVPAEHGTAPATFTAPLPEDFGAALAALRAIPAMPACDPASPREEQCLAASVH
jgi:23S rRNA pseudouridine1911/1915/1917 synthase